MDAQKNGGQLVKAAPTKELFISMLTRDLTMNDAIGEFVDNAVDGARALRPDKNYDGLQIDLEVNKDYFAITDNCGGIDVSLARDYAFRFGRAEGMPSIPGSIGYFGLGMKRALFKLGTKFIIESRARDSRFVLEVDVKAWQEAEGWQFEFKEYEENLPEIPEAQRGTKITVTELDRDVSESFDLGNFIIKLGIELSFEQLININRGLKILLNGHPLRNRQLTLLQSNEIKTAYWEHSMHSRHVKIYAGISQHDLDYGGWYVFCNDRLVLGPDQTVTTGWGARSALIPDYCDKFARFRGYVFFDTEDGSLLPWNTTKNGIVIDAPRFIGIRQRMLSMMDMVIHFLNRLHDDKKNTYNDDEESPLERALSAAQNVPLSQIKKEDLHRFFVPPQPIHSPPLGPDEARISYRKPIEKIEELRKLWHLKSFEQVGSIAFDYFYMSEISG